MMKNTMMGTKWTMGLMVLSLLAVSATPAMAAPIGLTSSNVTYSGQDIVSIDGLNFNIEAPDSMVITAWGSSVLRIKDTGADVATYSSGTVTPAHQAYLTDEDIDTAWTFNPNTPSATFDVNLATSMTATDANELDELALILFESGNGDSPTVQAFGSTGSLGSAVALTGLWGDTGATSKAINNTTGQDSVAVGLSLSDLGVTVGQEVTGFTFTTVDNWDPTEIMVDSNLAVPEPGSLALVLAGLVCLIGWRRRRA